MKANRETILDKTHYGLTIYAHVLQHYYPGETVLSLSGRDCQPTKNPFNNGKATLMVKVVDDCATHTDAEQAIASGNAFDFAALHFGLEGQALLEKINEALHLRIEKEKTPYSPNAGQQQVEYAQPKVKPPTFSYFTKPVSNVLPSKEVTLLEVYKLIKGDAFASCTSTLRNIQDSKEARKYKALNFDYVTFSGSFSKRNDANLQKHSGLLAVDFDHIRNLSDLKNALIADPYFETELLFISPSGDGLKWIIPIDLTQVKHQDYFRAVANYIQQTYKLPIDQSGKDISRACFLPHDTEIFINSKYV